MSFNFLNQGQTDDTATKFQPIDTFIDPVSKIRVSNPGNLIDTDFEYGLQPTKWETVEIINNTPAFFSKSGDTTISDITGITTNAGTREITVTTAFPHSLDVGIPIRVAGTKVVTADGSYIINATPTPTTFTYLSRANVADTVSIFDLYSSIITGEFFQGSQISISDSEGITTDGTGPSSTLTVKTSNKHGFGPKTPFYFLNLNSTVSKEFQSQNNTSLSFDPTNSATAQSFDGSNTLLQTSIDLSNGATTSIYQNSITSTDPLESTVTISINSSDASNWLALKYGDPLYYSVNIGSGYFQANPRGVVFIKGVDQIDATNNTATFQVSSIPDADPLPILTNMTGFFQIADQAKTFAGNNVDSSTQIEFNIEVGTEYLFDGGNQGYAGEALDPTDNSSTVVGYTGTNITVFTPESILDYYVGAMLLYSTDGNPATGLENNTTYFVTSFSPGASPGLYNMTIADFPGNQNISVSGGDGAQSFAKIGISVDKNIVHIKDSSFVENEMIQYTAPDTGPFNYDAAESLKQFFFIETAYDSHNYKLNEDAGFKAVAATGGNSIEGKFINNQLYKIHKFTSPGTYTFEVTNIGTEELNTIDYLVVGGGGGGGSDMGGGGGAGGVLSGSFVPTEPTSYTITVGSGGNSNGVGYNRPSPGGSSGSSSSAFGITALGGGGGAGGHYGGVPLESGKSGASGGGAGPESTSPGNGTAGQGFRGGYGSGRWYAAGGGGAGAVGNNGNQPGHGGRGIINSILGEDYYWGGGGGAGGYSTVSGNGGLGGGGGGGGGGAPGLGDYSGINPSDPGSGYGNGRIGGSGGANTGGGAGGHAHQGSSSTPKGSDGVVIIRYLDAVRESDEFISATGGSYSTITVGNVEYGVHQFRNVGNDQFEILNTSNQDAYNFVEYLVVGGGGGGGSDMGGGGGAGGVLSGSFSPSIGSYTVSVGNGGSSNGVGYSRSNPAGYNGQNSSVFGITALGGGGGAGGHYSGVPIENGKNGGSGGGAAPESTNPGLGMPGQGNRGGYGSGRWYAAGGGGAGAVGRNGNQPGDGGAGIQNSILGTSYYWGGGGGCGGYSTRSGNGGSGGGGGGAGGSSAGTGSTNGINPGSNGSGGGNRAIGGSGGANTGGGAGGHAHQGSSSTPRGGSGIVVIRYPIGASI